MAPWAVRSISKWLELAHTIYKVCLSNLVHQTLVEGEASSPQPNTFVAENA